ncbi:MAG: nicotinate (nicotinamide) nucleotide adenylyltransferase [Desulfonauticus sp.]|nr:nicotinate (nicotinamide) nucleotide adenylyltransferase [Desulfonauticus sp.]
MKKIGLLGGSFNPVHVGHLRLAIEALEVFKLDKVWLMPAYIPPHKRETGLLSYDIRLTLLNLSVKGLDNVEVTEIEGELGGVSYTVRTLQILTSRYVDFDFYFILGDKDFLCLPTWYKGKKLLDYANLLVARRNNFSLDKLSLFAKDFFKAKEIKSNVLAGAHKKVLFFDPLPISISSSLLREKFFHKKSLSYLVPDAVCLWLHEHRQEVENVWRNLPEGISSVPEG